MQPNASAQPLPEAGATQERTLEAVGCSALFGAGSGRDIAPGFVLPSLVYEHIRLPPVSCYTPSSDGTAVLDNSIHQLLENGGTESIGSPGEIPLLGQ